MNLRTVSFIVLILILIGGAGYYLWAYTLETIIPEEKVFTIGVVTNPPSLDPAWHGFEQGMKARGYIEGKNVRYIVESSGKDVSSAKKVIENMIEKDVDAFYVMGSLAGKTVKEITAEKKPTLPVVFGVISDPVGAKLVASLQNSGNNFTGVTPINEIIVSKRLEVLLEMIPSIKRIIFVWFDPNTSGIENLRKATKTLEIELVEKRVKDTSELMAFFNSYFFKPGDAILRATDSVSGLALKDIIAFALEKKIPLSGTNINDVELGGLMSYGANYFKIGEQAARLMDSVLKGAKPADLPIELAEEFEFVINAKTADTLNLTIPPASLNKANRIIR